MLLITPCSSPLRKPLILNQTIHQQAQREQDVAKQSLKDETTLMQSRVRLHTWRTSIKKRALTNQVKTAQVNPNPYPYPYPNPIPNRNPHNVSSSNPKPKPKCDPYPNPTFVETHGGNAG